MNSAYIDSLVDKIQDERTKEYFKEVLSSFYSENYRSAVVMLYSCVIHDLIFKLMKLEELMDDKSAKNILDTIRKELAGDSKSSKWELDFTQKMFKQKKIIDTPTYIHIENLKNERNLCAHPTFNEYAKLYRPNKATVQSLIINMLEGVFCKSYMIGAKELYEDFVKDIAEGRFLEKEVLNKIIGSKYLEKINEEEEYKLFKSLWKNVFKLKQEDDDQNRKANFNVLKFIIGRNRDYYIDRIQKDSDYYSKRIDTGYAPCMKYLIAFLNEYPKIFKLLSVDMQMLIKNLIHDVSKYKNVSLFLVILSGEDVKQHIFNLGFLGDGNFDYLYKYVSDNFGDSEANNFLIDQFSKVNDFVDTKMFFDEYMEPRINDFDYRQLKEIINVMNENSQIYNYGGIYTRVNTIANKIKKQEPNFDFSLYDNINLKLN